MTQDSERGPYCFVRGLKPTLPDEIFAYALIDYWLLTAREEQTLSFETLLHGPGSPGGAFKLSEIALSDRLERLPVWTGLTYDDTAGMRIVLRREAVDPSERVTALTRYYGVNPEIRSHDREMQELMR